MRAVVQRVSHASVRVRGEPVAEINGGILLLVGVAGEDTSKDAVALADKVANLRIFADDAGKMNRSVVDTGGSVLIVSQFTLYADTRRGRRPSFVAAAPPDRAEPLIAELLTRLQDLGVTSHSGRFGAHMEVELVNDGPVTILIET